MPSPQGAPRRPNPPERKPSAPAPTSAGGAAALAGSAGSSNAGGAGASGAGTTTTESKWKGRLVKRFRLLDEIGEGAMGKVFIAEDTILKRHVALKLLPAKFKDGRPNHRTERLIKEARSAASLEHPNTLSIYEIDQSGGVHYIAMELAEGGDLEDLVQLSGPMEVERACSLAAEAAEALAHAHARGIIHRDVKPGNLLLTRNGRCKVCDFGLAAFDDATDAEGRAKVVGTPYYIAPEIAMGNGATASSDIYSLGCTLFFLLTGRPPFSGTSAREVMKQHISSPLPDLRRWRPDLPEKLVAAIEQATAKDPAQRFNTAERFGKVLRTFTIPTGSSGSLPHLGGSGEHGGSPGLSGGGGGYAPGGGGYAPGGGGYANGSGAPPLTHGALPPISAAQLEAILPKVDAHNPSSSGEWSSRLPLSRPALYAICATVATALLIALGMMLSRPSKQPDGVATAPPPAPTAPAGASAPAAVASTPAAIKAPPPTPALAPAVAAVPAAVPAAAPAAPAAPAASELPPASTAPPSAAAATTAAIAAVPDSTGNIIVNGTMDAVDEKGRIATWFVPERCRAQVKVMKEGINSFLRVTNDDNAVTVHAAQKLDLDPSWRVVTVSARMRSASFKEGKTSSGVTISFHDENDKTIGRWTPGLRVKGDFPWTDRVITADIPPGAKKLYLQCVLSYATGTLDFDDVKVVPQTTSAGAGPGGQTSKQ